MKRGLFHHEDILILVGLLVASKGALLILAVGITGIRGIASW